MATPDTKNSIVIFSSLGYRGGTKIWSNRYHFEGDLPADATHWETLADNIIAAQKATLYTGNHITQAMGYDAGTATSTNPHGDAVWNKTYSVAGTFTPGAGDRQSPGDCAALIRYDTPARSSRNHPVYLFNYYHLCFQQTADQDALAADYQSALQTYGDAWVTGFSDGSITRERCGPRGAVATAAHVSPYVRHRDFPN